MHGRVPDDPACADLTPSGFELRLDQGDHVAVGCDHLAAGRQDKFKGDKGDIDGDEIRTRAVQGLEPEVSRVGLFVERDARIRANLPICNA